MLSCKAFPGPKCLKNSRFLANSIRQYAASSTGGDGGEDPKSQSWITRILTGPQVNLEGVQKQSHSSLLSVSETIYEIQTHDAIGGRREDYIKAYRNYAQEVTKCTPGAELFGSWAVLFGNQDQVVNLWRYKNGYVDIDSYVLKPGTMIEWGNAWSKGITYRREYNQDVGGFFAQVGQLYMVFHIWAYKGMVSRQQTRQHTWSKPGWDQTVAYTVPLISKMQSRILVPTELSKLQ
ncbi:NIPSNAP domain-containing protein [Ditylenchus destructor]|nr:NIPSNAP domain-containing protein [Ditylenchus destructor]